MLHRILSSSAISYHGKFTSPSSVGTYGWLGTSVLLTINLALNIGSYKNKLIALQNFSFLFALQRKLKLESLGLLNGILH